MNIKKIIFLDIDGVLNNLYYFDPNLDSAEEINADVDRTSEMKDYIYNKLSPFFTKGDPALYKLMDIDVNRISLLNKIIKETGAQIVFSSSWNKDPYLPLYLAIKGFLYPESCIGSTPDIGERGLNILSWLHNNEYDRFLVIDDETDKLVPYINAKNIIKVRPLTDEDADLIIEKTKQINTILLKFNGGDNMKPMHIVGYNIAYRAHKGQFRKDGITPYIEHPKEVAKLVTTGNLLSRDLDFLKTVSMLHDVLEDSDITYTELKEIFNEEVANCVLALTKRDDEKKADALKRAMTHKDKRVTLVKKADRTHNLRDSATLDNSKENREFKLYYLKQTKEHFMPYLNKDSHLDQLLMLAWYQLRDSIEGESFSLPKQ